MKKALRMTVWILAAVFVVIQFFPPDRSTAVSNPALSIVAVTAPPQEIEGILRKACFDCHSNETQWPLYSVVAPASWFVANDVTTGRKHLNFSDWGNYSPRKRGIKFDQMQDEVLGHDMPPSSYTLLHAQARLTEQERKTLAAWASSERQKTGDSAVGGEHR